MPAGIAERPRDVRGFPITFVTFIGSDGRPDFTTIDAERILDCLRERLCGMCGHELGLGENVAFIGGPKSIEHGNFLDPPMHPECARYAMKVCPHIAIPTARYGKPLENGEREYFDQVDPNRPEKFGLIEVLDYGITRIDGQPVFLINPFAGTTTWQEDL